MVRSTRPNCRPIARHNESDQWVAVPCIPLKGRFQAARRSAQGRYAELHIATPMHSTQLCVVHAAEARPAWVGPVRTLHSYSCCRNFKRSAAARYRRILFFGTSDSRLMLACRIHRGLLQWNHNDSTTSPKTMQSSDQPLPPQQHRASSSARATTTHS